MIKSNHRVVLLKKENKELRAKLKALNTKLTSIFDGIKVAQPSKAFDKHMPLEVMENEIRNADRQIASYKNEIAFLAKRLQDGNQIKQIELMEQENDELKSTEHHLTKKLAEMKIRHNVLMSKGKRLEIHTSHQSKVSAMTDKRKAFVIKHNQLEKENESLKSKVETQRNFADKIHKRYLAVCSSLGAKPELEFSFTSDQLASVKLDPQRQKARPKIRSAILQPSFKRKEVAFTQSLMLDDPDNYIPPETDEEFERLKHKVINMLQSARVEHRKSNIVKKSVQSKTVDHEAKIALYGTFWSPQNKE